MGYLGYIGVILGLYRDNRKENGNYYLGFRVQGLGIEFGVYGSLCQHTQSHVLFT